MRGRGIADRLEPRFDGAPCRNQLGGLLFEITGHDPAMEFRMKLDAPGTGPGTEGMMRLEGIRGQAGRAWW